MTGAVAGAGARVAITMPATARPTAARMVAGLLREEILGHPGADPWFLGSEDELLERLGVSRPTLRQAARLLEAEQLLEVRRGLKGGLYGRKPDTEGVIHATSVFLRSEGTTLLDVVEVQVLVTPACAGSAARHPDPAARAALLDFALALRDTAAGPDGIRRYGRARIEFSRRLAELSHNPVLRLVQHLLADIAATGGPVLLDPGAVGESLDYYESVARCIAAGDAEGAESAARAANLQTLHRVRALADSEGLSVLRTR
jgi:DNA-binding FadR family transcriptional regulator